MNSERPTSATRAQTSAPPRKVVRKVPQMWRLAAAGVLFTATVEHIRNPGKPWFRRITITSSVPIQCIPSRVAGWLQGQVEDDLGLMPVWLRERWVNEWRTYRHNYYTKNARASEITDEIHKLLAITEAEAETQGGWR